MPTHFCHPPPTSFMLLTSVPCAFDSIFYVSCLCAVVLCVCVCCLPWIQEPALMSRFASQLEESFQVDYLHFHQAIDAFRKALLADTSHQYDHVPGRGNTGQARTRHARGQDDTNTTVVSQDVALGMAVRLFETCVRCLLCCWVSCHCGCKHVHTSVRHWVL